MSIEGIGDDLNPIGRKEIQLANSSTFILTAKKGKEIVKKSIYVEVFAKKQVEKPKSTPVQEKRNISESKYVKGLVNAENVKENDNPSLFINLIDIKEYPKKVKLFVTVKDKYGNSIANLAPPYNYAYVQNWKSLFEEIEGKDYQITAFTVEEIREDVAPPFTTAFVLDYSGSMFGDYQFVDNAVKKAVNYIRPNVDDYEVVQFDHFVYRSVDFTQNPNDIHRLIPFKNLGGYTAFYSASILGLNDISSSKKEKVAILFTDGADNASLFTTAYDVVLKAREVGARVFIIGFNREYGGFLVSILNAMATLTGGKAYFPQRLDELDDIFAEIYQIMKVYYVVSYTATKTEGNIRLVKLNFDFPSLNKVLSASKPYYVKPDPIKEASKRKAVAWFDVGKSTIKEQYMKTIQEVAEFLKENPSKKIVIIGHTDSRGSDALNNALSLRRAKFLANLLIKLGVNKNQIQKVEGRGEKELIYPNETNDYELQENRRVEIEFI